ncbi:hypothetical protein ACP70R_005676 [Stipagrostis hirtigluma subsp. patula]
MREGAGDRISGLPDELLHAILLRLRSTRAAARTSVLSRRWRHVWAHLPELALFGFGSDSPPPDSFIDAIDAVLAAYSAPAVNRLDIGLPNDCSHVLVRRVEAWLRFASQHVVGAFHLFVPSQWPGVEAELQLPSFAGAAIIRLRLQLQWRLRLPPAGLFKALTSLEIFCCGMEGSELTALVSTQCPRLRKLRLFITLVALSDVSIRSDSLHSILEICRESIVASLMQRFDNVDKLALHISVPQGIAGYERFLNETNKLPKCETLEVYLTWFEHGLVPIMLHFLRSCYSTKKFDVALVDSRAPLLRNSCPSGCPCRLAESHNSEKIALHSLEEVGISYFSGSHEEVEFVEKLSKCTAAILKKLTIDYIRYPASPLTKEMCEEVRSKCHPNVKVEFFVALDGRRVRFD